MAGHQRTAEIVILSDGKPGHLNQSLAVAHLTELPNRRVIPVHYRGKLHRYCLSLLIHLPLTPTYCKFLLTLTLKHKTVKDLLNRPARAVISAGSSLNHVNLAISRIHSAKSIVIMRPSLGRQRSYDLRIIPKHDDPKYRPNTVITMGAPTLISQLDLRKHGQELAHRNGLSDAPKIALFIGGDCATHRLTVEVMEKIMSAVSKVCHATHRHLLITTSRRTSSAVERLIESRWGSSPSCELLVIPNTSAHTSENTLAGMMGLADILLVTEDSVSMISEAASSGKKVIVIETERTKKSEVKHRRMIKSLLRGHYISTCRPSVLEQVVLDKLRDSSPPKVLKDSAVIKRALNHLL